MTSGATGTAAVGGAVGAAAIAAGAAALAAAAVGVVVGNVVPLEEDGRPRIAAMTIATDSAEIVEAMVRIMMPILHPLRPR